MSTAMASKASAKHVRTITVINRVALSTRVVDVKRGDSVAHLPHQAPDPGQTSFKSSTSRPQRYQPVNPYDAALASIPSVPYPPQASTSRLPANPVPLSFSFDSSKRSYVFQHGAAGSAKHGHSPSGGSSGSSKALQAATGASGEAERGHRPTAGSRENEVLSVQVGEDAYFLRNDALGVADGVGGWTGRHDADPALFSRKIMHHCSSELARYDDFEDELFLTYYDVDPVEVLQTAVERSLSEAQDEGIVGSTTALLAVLRRDELRVANLGDCCCSVIRGRDFIFRSEEQQHSFNYPFQVGTNRRDMPRKDAQRFDIKVQKGDIVILSSDGLVDNLFDEDILEEVLRHARYGPVDQNGAAGLSLSRFVPQIVSEALCKRAKAVSEDQHAVTSPFQQKAMDEGMYYVGGKNDDITVLVSVVCDSEDSPDRR